jgi:hypothetical protein
MQELEDIGGGHIFIIQSFYDFSLIFFIVIRCVIYGAEANIIDQKIRTVLNELQKESIEAKTLCDLGLIYKKAKTMETPLTMKNMFIIHKMKDGTFKDQDG